MTRDYRNRPPVDEDRLDRILDGILSRQFAQACAVVLVSLTAGYLAAVALGLAW